MTMTLIESKTLLSAAASIEFTSIPQDGTDLVVLFSLRITTSGYDATPWVIGNLSLNGVGVSSARQLFGTGSASGSDTNTAGAFAVDTNGTTNTFSSGQWYIPNYTSSNNKSSSIDVVTENNGTSALQIIWAGITNTTSPVTTLGISFTDTYAIGTTISLYKVTKGSDGIVTTS